MKKYLFLTYFLCGILFAAKSQTTDSTTHSETEKTVIEGDSSKYMTLCVYRPYNIMGMAIGYNLYVGNTLVCRIKNNTKYAIKIKKEGKTEIWAKTEAKELLVLDVKYGETYYVRCGLTMGAMVGRPSIKEMDREKGKQEYDKMKSK